MKLLTRTMLWSMAGVTLALLAGGIVFYVNLRNMIDDEVTESLYIEKQKFLEVLAKGQLSQQLPDITRMQYAEVKTAIPERLSDTTFFSNEEQEELPYRQLRFSARAGDKLYAVSLQKTLIESDDLTEAIAVSLAILAGGLLILLFILNSWIFRRLWKPFYKALDRLRHFDLKQGPLPASPEKTKEFNALNHELQLMSERITSDYTALKTFTENAAHELQTPLAIISSKAEMLLQHGDFSEEQAGQLRQIYEAAHRLSKINQALLMLAKIENRQYAVTTEIDLVPVIRNKIADWQELLNAQDLQISTDLDETRICKIHPYLAEVLVGNLLGNAIRYAPKKSTIHLRLRAGQFEISNEGKAFATAPEKLFDRFVKERPDSASAGLGLAIVKSIADVSGWAVDYAYRYGRHTFIINGL